MGRHEDWDDGNYMEWADQERLVRQDVEEIYERIKFEIEDHMGVKDVGD